MPRDLSLAFLAQATSSSGRFALTILLVRTLGLERFGVVAVALLACGYAAGLVQALVAQPMLSIATGRAPSSRTRRAILDAAIWSAAVVAGALGLAACGAAFAMKMPELAAPAALVVASQAFYVALRARSFADESKGHVVATDFAVSWGSVLFVAMVPVGVAPAMWSVAAGGVLACTLALGVARPRRVPLRRLVAIDRRLWRSGRWLVGTQVSSWLGTGGVQAATLAYLGPLGIGALRAAQSVVGAALALVQALELALPARAARACATGELHAWTRRTMRDVSMPLAVGGLAVALGSPWIAGVVFGPSSAAIAPVLAILAALPALASVTSVLQVGRRALEDTRPILTCYVVAAVLALVAAVPVVDAAGVRGAAAVLVGQQALFAVLLLRSSRADVKARPTYSSA